LFAGMLLCLELGRRLGRRATAGEAEGAIAGTGAVEGVRRQNDPATTELVLSALNSMFDISTTRTAVMYMHSPGIIFAMLFLLALACAFLAGLGMSRAKSRLWIHIIGFAAVASLTVYVILEIEYPRLGVIRVDAADKVLVDLRETMK
jgi:hypothetical protein